MKLKLRTTRNTMATALLVVFAWLCHLPATAVEKEWLMVFQSADGVSMEFSMSEVGSLVAVDDAYDFTIHSTLGDVNGDGNVNSADVQKIYQLMAKGATGTTNPEADLNDDGRINSADIQKVYAIMAGGGDDSHAPAGAVAVDLGLPSGTKWANMNVGAEEPEDYGDYFAWGETKPKDYYDWSTYIHCDGHYMTCHDLGSDISGDSRYDAARANWGGQWRMPTLDNIYELLDNTTNEWVTVNGVNGCKFTSKTNGNSIFLPAAGDHRDSGLYTGTSGYYWSSTLYEGGLRYARSLYFNSGGAGCENGFARNYGHTVRPVR